MTNYSWVGGSGDWSSAANWSPIGVPGPADVISFEVVTKTATGFTPTPPYIISGDATLGTIGFYNGNRVTFSGTVALASLNVDLGGILSIPAGSIVSVQAGIPGALPPSPYLPDGTLRSRLFGDIVVGGVLTDVAAIVASSTVSVSGIGASWTNTGTDQVRVGYLPPQSESFDYPSRIDLLNHAQFSGNFLLLQEATLNLDPTATLSGSIELQGGTLHAKVASDLSATPVIMTNAVTLDGITLSPSSGLFPPALNSAVSADPGTALILQGGLVGTGSLVLSGGTITIGPVGAHTLTFDKQNTTLVLTNGTPTLLGGGGTNVVFGGASTITAVAGAGRFTFVGERGSDTVYGGAGSAIEVGGSAGGNVLVASLGASTLFGGGAGDLLVANGSGGDILVAASGNATLTAAGASGNNTLVGGAGNNVLVAGRGSDQVIAGSGATTIFGGGGGTNAIFAGSGTDLVVAGAANAYIQAGRGNLAAVAGRGADYFGFVAGAGGGDDALVGFKSGVDKINLQGFGSGAVDAVLQSAQRFGAATVLSLSDGTRISVYGAGTLTKADFV